MSEEKPASPRTQDAALEASTVTRRDDSAESRQPSLSRACVLDCGHMIFSGRAVGDRIECPDHGTTQQVVEVRRLYGGGDE